jgi:hypothetical protein
MMAERGQSCGRRLTLWNSPKSPQIYDFRATTLISSLGQAPFLTQGTSIRQGFFSFPLSISPPLIFATESAAPT